MKKSTKIALLVAAILIAVGATLCNIARGRGENLGALVSSGGLTVSSGKVDFGFDQSGYTVCTSGEESFKPSDVRTLDIGWLSGKVNVEPHSGAEILLREESRQTLEDSQRMRWKLSGGKLSVLFCASGASNVPDKSLTVLVPKDWIAEEFSMDATSAEITLRALSAAKTIAVDSTSGETCVEDCACAELDLETTSGDIKITGTSVSGTLDVEATSGALVCEGSAFGALEADSSSGSVRLEETAVSGMLDVNTTSGSVSASALPAGCRAKVETSSGDVMLAFRGAPEEVDVETTSGAVALSFPKGTTLDLDFDSSSGKLSGSMTTAPGGIPVRVDTTSGDLTIREG